MVVNKAIKNQEAGWLNGMIEDLGIHNQVLHGTIPCRAINKPSQAEYHNIKLVGLLQFQTQAEFEILYQTKLHN